MGHFIVPQDIKSEWEVAGIRGSAECVEWEARLEQSDPALASEFKRRVSGALPSETEEEVRTAITKAVDAAKSEPIRKGSLHATEVLANSMPELNRRLSGFDRQCSDNACKHEPCSGG